MNIENLSTLKIHKLTQEQYDRALAEGNIDPNAIYLTPESSVKGVSPHIGDNGNWWIGDEDTGVAATAGAEAADAAAERAESQALLAGNSANDAASSASEASGYATSASRASNNANTAMTNAETAATNAANSASSASSSASTATTQANNAKNSASAAATSASQASTSATQAGTSASEAGTAANTAKGYRDEVKNMLDNAVIDPSEAVLVTSQNLTNTQKVTARENIGAASQADLEALNNEKADKTYVDAEIAKLSQATPEFVDSIEECTDPSKMYVLPDGYIYAYMTKQEEIVIPGETITTPAKAVIIKGYRYSKSAGAFQAESGVASVVFPVEITKTTTSGSESDLVLTNMLGHASRSAIYSSDTNTQFGAEAVRVARGTFSEFGVYGVPVGKKFVIFFIQYSGSETFNNASLRYDSTIFTVGENMEVYSDPEKASLATFGTTTTTEGTTEIIDKSGFYSTGLTYSGGDYDDEIAELRNAVETLSSKAVIKGNSIVVNNDVQALTSSVSLTIPQLKKNKTIAFSGIYTGTLSELSIIQGEGTGFTECKCVVTATTITVSKNGSSVYTAEHGLTFGTHFSFVLATKNSNKTKAYLCSGGKTFTSSEFVWDTARRDLKLYTSTPFTAYQFAFGSGDFDKKIWMYGDSYFAHWMTAGINRGYTNCLVDGYSGGGSSAGLASLRISLEHGTPEKIVWCLGMNDGDKGAINQNWLTAITAVKEICDQNGIELWVSTIPNVPTVDNTYKNAYIRANFDNVVDVCKYVGADESTSWYTGLLSSDGVHPSSSSGDFYIANVMETYFPELLDS